MSDFMVAVILFCYVTLSGIAFYFIRDIRRKTWHG